MSREEVKTLFNSWGVENPTDDQVSDYLNKIQQATKSAEDKANRYKAEADKVKDLQKQLDDLNTANLTEVEKLQKSNEDLLATVDSLRKTVKQKELNEQLAGIGIVGDDATSLVGEDGLDVAKLGEILAAREKNAVAAYQKQALDNTPSPNGGKEEESDKPYKDIVDRVVASKKTENDASSIVDAYK